VSRFLRWQIVGVFVAFSGLVLGLTALGTWAYWAVEDPAIRAVRVFTCLIFASCVGLSVSIGLVDWDEDFPWRRAGTLLLFLLLGFGVGWARHVIA
jgi:hypothetical protein